MTRRLIVEADGGSRGNPGVAGYGALVRDGETREVLAERAAPLGKESNNVAEYTGLIEGLRAVVDHAPGAAVTVRMDSKLVVEQMAGRWKVKHAGLVPLVEEARALAPAFVDRLLDALRVRHRYLVLDLGDLGLAGLLAGQAPPDHVAAAALAAVGAADRFLLVTGRAGRRRGRSRPPCS